MQQNRGLQRLRAREAKNKSAIDHSTAGAAPGASDFSGTGAGGDGASAGTPSDIRPRLTGLDETTAKYKRLQRRMDVNSLNGAIRVLKFFGTHDDLAAATLALWRIAGPAREKAREKAREVVE